MLNYFTRLGNCLDMVIKQLAEIKKLKEEIDKLK